MIKVLDVLSFCLSWGYTFVFFWMIKAFLQLRKNRILWAAAFLYFGYLSNTVIYSNDWAGLVWTLAAFLVYVFLFHQGRTIEKLSAVLVFYPALIAVNYLMQDIGLRMFLWITKLPRGFGEIPEELLVISTAVHTVSLLCRLVFWLGAWLIMRRFLLKITARLTTRMWLIVDMLMLASFVAIITIIYFLPEEMIVVYPICGASIFSSFGCMYLASYICNSMEVSYQVQKLEMQRDYYKDRVRDEERVRSIYHDLKNHLLVLQEQSESEIRRQEAVENLKEQIAGYETYQNTGNEFLDMIIRDKSRAAQEKQIDFSAVIHFEDGGFLEPLDISTIFGNSLDNAIEASEKLPPEQRLITVKVNRVRDLLVAVVENNAPADTISDGGTTKKDTLVHGLGLPNIKRAVEKYDGQCSIKAENGVFSLKMILPIP